MLRSVYLFSHYILLSLISKFQLLKYWSPATKCSLLVTWLTEQGKQSNPTTGLPFVPLSTDICLWVKSVSSLSTGSPLSLWDKFLFHLSFVPFPFSPDLYHLLSLPLIPGHLSLWNKYSLPGECGLGVSYANFDPFHIDDINICNIFW